MTPQTFNQDGTILDAEEIYDVENEQESAYAKILTPEELRTSRLMNVRFFTAKHQVPNDHIVTTDKDGNITSEPIWDKDDRKYKNFDMIRIETVGDAGIPTVVDQFVNDFHIMRFPDRYKAFKEGKVGKVEGALVDELKKVPRHAIAAMNAAGVFTIEQLANLSNPNVIIANGTTYQKIAKAHLANSSEAKASKLEEEAAAMKAEMEEMKKQLAALLKAKTKE